MNLSASGLALPPSVLRAFRRRLTNLSSRNRSLLLSRLPSAQVLDLHETDFLLNNPSFQVVAGLIRRQPSVALCAVLDPRHERTNQVSRKLRALERTVRFIRDERGTEDLYVGWPFVRGKFADGTVVHAPLLFFPVGLARTDKHWQLERRGDEPAFLNATFALAYGQFNAVKISEAIIQKTTEDFPADSLAFRTELYEWLKSSPLEINFNVDLFTDQLRPFDAQTARGLNQLERTGELKLHPEAVLGIFPQAGSFLAPDYDQLINEKEIEEGDEREEARLTFSFPSSFPDGGGAAFRPLPENKIHTPLPMDASQEAAVRAVKAGTSLVVQGPPGTGKSQLIANLMADAAASGKRVLLVCQKRAALDVVQTRLRTVGMEPFLALIHDVQNDRRALYDQISAQISRIDTYRQQNNGINAVLLERDFDHESRQIDEAVTELQQFKDALFNTSMAGVSVKELYLTSDPDGPVIPLDDVYEHFPIPATDDFIQRLTAYALYQQRLGLQHPFAERVSFAHFSETDRRQLGLTIDEVGRISAERTEAIRQTFGVSLDWPTLRSYAAHVAELAKLLRVLEDARIWSLFRQYATGQLTSADRQRLVRAQAELNELAGAGTLRSVAPPDGLWAFDERLRAGVEARQSRFRWLFYRDKPFLRDVAGEHGLTLRLTDLRTLTDLLARRLRWETILAEAIKPFADHPALSADPTCTQRKFDEIIEVVNQATAAWKILQKHVPTLKRWTGNVADQSAFLRGANQLHAWLTDLNADCERWQTYLMPAQIEALARNPTESDTLKRALRQDFDVLVETDQLRKQFSLVETLVVDRLGELPPGAWVTTFLNALRLTWLEAIEQRYPELRSVSSGRMTQMEQTLRDSIGRKQALSQSMLLIRLREQTYRHLTVNRLNNVVTYRNLLHQTTKKRNVWPVRKLMESYADEVFKLIPCWMASPEAVSVLFPLREGSFDLVIFDEASQCFAELGIPAMARGRQIIVTGDSQQLRPGDLYQTRLTDTDAADVPPALELESLLELAAHYLPQVSLTEHYRSRSPELISFSNARFYRNQLQFLPLFDRMNRPEPAITYQRVEGVWQQQTNAVEASAVVQLLDRIATELPGCSVGVVTFNQPQQQLIQDLLDDAATSGGPAAWANAGDEPLFVKNIENVQGDERDVIIFSVGCAPDERGRLAMQFGSLNVRGGENRLNVAITRARERVYVVTSLWPEQLPVDDTANEGPKLLKAYLQYALTVAQGGFQVKPSINVAIPSKALLKDTLAAQHLTWQPELPFADLTVRAGDTYQSLVLTDDEAYYAQTIKQAHAYLPRALTARHWPFVRIWSREFWRKTVL